MFDHALGVVHRRVRVGRRGLPLPVEVDAGQGATVVAVKDAF